MRTKCLKNGVLDKLPLSHNRILQLKQLGYKAGIIGREKFILTMRRKKEEKAKLSYEQQKKRLLHLSPDSLYIAGIMLYLSEGDKKNKSRINLANTDPKIIRFFIKWLRNFWNTDIAKIKIQLHLYENMDIEKEEKFWQTTLKLSSSQFYQSNVRKLVQSSFTYRDSFGHGTCSLNLLDTVKKTDLMMAIQAFMDLYL